MQETSLGDLGLTARSGDTRVRIRALTLDSRTVKPGTLFAALPGSRVHGAEFIDPALRMGASAVLTDRDGARIAADTLARHPDVALIVAEDPREALARAAALFYGAQPAVMVAVTGTNGKTSVASFTRQIWAAMGHAAINVGTTGVEGVWGRPLAHTTPDPLTLQSLLADAAEAGVTHAAMEASSHGLDQRRLDGVRLAAAAFTNLTQDHLDYHATMEEYFQAKAGLFTRLLPEDGVAVINTDDRFGARLVRLVSQPVLAVGSGSSCDLQLIAQRFHAQGQTLRFGLKGRSHQVELGLVGGFQGANALLALGLVIATGGDTAEAITAMAQLQGVRGRMQLAATRDNGAPVFVDYAHTPAAVETALKALRPHVMGRLIVVLGAGGDRDKTKRPLMGKAAAENADVVFVTDDNPRSEVPATIRAEIVKACPDAIEVADRAEAILRAVDALEPGDALLIAGKGHETGQTIGDVVYPFDDLEQASVAVAALDGKL
ncbi:UDP-N-acetylmuramoyl-L-alanyl-D-glutamate--2,6-diaminopimelate ligase [Pararhodobacter zhoushanensis]|uniref:UDP-N-acetylmuramoyl-L-alanyl-D-glutamate--2, 6-diaminopimelate ligase n=1 Tax=Pararhodobacter zhoushanensis TaxID=2479545 RepID=UPI000F8E4ECC|nr:UDP-N-acetylmuramoyl-L-alanyl-D-glutamate--2,6-diaminopimelate ligase [Pararhodobacter zhoushanensis]